MQSVDGEDQRDRPPGAGCPRSPGAGRPGTVWLLDGPLPAFASFDGKFSQKTGSSLAEVWVHGPELPGFSVYTYAYVYICIVYVHMYTIV